MYSLIWWLMTIMMMMCLRRTSGNIFIVSRETLRKRCCCWLYTTADHVILNVSVKDGALGIVGGTGIVAGKYHRSTLSKIPGVCFGFFFLLIIHMWTDKWVSESLPLFHSPHFTIHGCHLLFNGILSSSCGVAPLGLLSVCWDAVCDLPSLWV